MAARIYNICIGILGIALLILELKGVIPGYPGLGSIKGSFLFVEAGILLALSIFASMSPIRTPVGGMLTASLSIMLANALALPTPTAMLVSGIGTINQRVPGKDISWDAFFFNRGAHMITTMTTALVMKLTSMHLHGTLSLLLAVLASSLALATVNIVQPAISLSLAHKQSLFQTIAPMMRISFIPFGSLIPLGVVIGWLASAHSEFSLILIAFLLTPLVMHKRALEQSFRLDRWLHENFIMLSRVIDQRDHSTFGHSERVGDLAQKVAQRLDLDEKTIMSIKVAGNLHDLGKIAIPDSILLKKGPLTKNEFELIKQHTNIGADILSQHEEHRTASEFVRYHHENYDGSGYPYGLRGEDIPLGARIIRVCDSYDVITSPRPYKNETKDIQGALEELDTLKGKWYDPRVVETLKDIIISEHHLADQSGLKQQKRIARSSSLISKNFAVFLSSQSLTYFAETLITVAIAYLATSVYRSITAVTVLFASRYIGSIIVTPFTGLLIDRFSEKVAMALANAIRVIPCIFLGIIHPPITLAALLIAILGIGTGIFQPARQSYIPHSVERTQLIVANSMTSFASQIAQTAGYLIGGFVAFVASDRLIFLLIGGLFTCTFLLTIRGIDWQQPGMKHKNACTGVRSYIAFVRKNSLIKQSLLWSFGVSIMAALLTPLLAPLLSNLVHSPHSASLYYGLLLAILSAGMLTGPLVVPFASKLIKVGLIMALGALGMGLCMSLIALQSYVPVLATLLFFSGIANMMYYVTLSAVMQQEAPEEVRGTLLSFRFLMVQIGSGLSIFLAGPVSQLFGVNRTVQGAGILLTLLGIYALAARTLRKADLKVQRAGAESANASPININS